MDRYNKKNILEKNKTFTPSNSHDYLWNSVWGGVPSVPSLKDFTPFFIFGAVALCCSFIPITTTKLTANKFATLSYHRQAFAPRKSIEQPISSASASLLTSKPVAKCPISASALKEKGPCSACSIEFKGAQQSSPKTIPVHLTSAF